MTISKEDTAILVICDRCGDNDVLGLDLDADDDEVREECIRLGYKPDPIARHTFSGRSNYTEYYKTHTCGDCGY